MSIFAKHNDLPATLKTRSKEINLVNSCYSILNDSSNINIKNTTISGCTPFFNTSNSNINIINSEINDNTNNSIVIGNSKYYIDNLQFLDKKFIYVENGSLFNYTKTTYAINDSLFNIKSANQLLIIPSDDTYKNYKDKYVASRGLEDFGTGNLFYSTHLLTNGSYGYWGNKFGGLFTNNTNITASTYNKLKTLITTMPRNLNGYTVTIKCTLTSFNNNVDINNFYNGKLILTFNKDLNDTIVNFGINNNNCLVDITFTKGTKNINFNLNDNRDLKLNFNTLLSSAFNGNNNYIEMNIASSITDISSFFNINSYGNKIAINSTTANNNTLDSLLRTNNKLFGNYITVVNNINKIGDLVNDSNLQVTDNNTYMTFTIDGVNVKKYRDVTDIGTIIGWNAKLPVPRGYYVCSGQLVAVDIRNNQDDFYNGQLAYYLNGNLSLKTIAIPYVPSAKPTCMTTDQNYCTDSNGKPNFKPQDLNAKLIYIIKYNNNFLNKKGN